MTGSRIVFLTGANSGIGAALARLYAAQGATLGLFARRQAELDTLFNEQNTSEAATSIPATFLRVTVQR